MSWPSDSRGLTAGKVKQSEREKKIISHSNYSGPVLHGGTLGAASLTDLDDSVSSTPKWIFASHPHKRLRLNFGSPATRLLSETRPSYVPKNEYSPVQKLEQSTRYLRTYHPDLDIPVEILQGELTATNYYPQSDHLISGEYDPLPGNRLAVVKDSWANEPHAHLVFPSGQVGQKLNIQPIVHKNDSVVLSSSNTYVPLAFPTEIQQISADRNGIERSPLIAVRTLSSLSFVRPERSNLSQGRRSATSSSFTRATTIAEFAWQNIYSDHALGTDVCFSPYEEGESLLVGDTGSIIQISLDNRGGHTVNNIPQRSNGSEGSDFGRKFWRIAWGASASDALLANDRFLWHIDHRSPSPANELLCLNSQDEYLTAVEGPVLSLNAHLICVSTTDSIIWMDHRQPKKSFLAWRHGRSRDRTVQAHTVHSSSARHTFLTSRTNSLITVYNVNQGSNPDNYHTISSMDQPYNLSYTPFTYSSDFSRAGLAFVERPQSYYPNSTQASSDARPVVDFFELSSRGGIFHRVLSYDASGVSEGTATRTIPLHDDAPVTLENRASNDRSDRERTVVDMSGLYKVIGNADRSRSRAAPLRESIHALQAMPLIWQNSEEPLEQPLTTFDIALRSGNEPVQSSRADFLAGSSVTYAAVKSFGGLPTTDIGKGAPWSYDVSSLLRKLDSTLDLPHNSHSESFSQSLTLLPAIAIDKLRDLSLLEESNPDNPLHGLGDAESTALEMISLDLAMSRHVFFPHKPELRVDADVSSQIDAADVLSQATQALSIAQKEPPAARFGYFKPAVAEQMRDRSDGESDEVEMSSNYEKAFKQPIGARLLLTEWTTGSDPDSYQFTDLYGSSTEPGELSRSQPSASMHPTQITLTQQSLNPPAIAISASQALPPKLQSSTNPLDDRQVPSFVNASQPTFPSTRDKIKHFTSSQVFPGEKERLFGSQGFESTTAMEVDDEFQMTSTQVLPGRFGGRPQAGAAKKKPKKRMGGF